MLNLSWRTQVKTSPIKICVCVRARGKNEQANSLSFFHFCSLVHSTRTLSLCPTVCLSPTSSMLNPLPPHLSPLDASSPVY